MLKPPIASNKYPLRIIVNMSIVLFVWQISSYLLPALKDLGAHEPAAQPEQGLEPPLGSGVTARYNPLMVKNIAPATASNANIS